MFINLCIALFVANFIIYLLIGAAAIRAATSSETLARYGSPVCKPKLKNQDSPSTSLKRDKDVNLNQSPKPRNRNEILYSKDEEEPNEKIDKIIEKKTKEIEETKNKIKDSEKTPKNKNKQKNVDNSKKKVKEPKKLFDTPVNSLNTSKKVEDSYKEKQKELKRKNKDDLEDNKKNKKVKNDRVTKPFERLLEGVILVISGIQNPDRANLRSLALAMGARYKSDWDNSCTHLM